MSPKQQLELPLGTRIETHLRPVNAASRESNSDRNGPDRVFVPLSAEPYSWFDSGKKTWELRKAERQFTETHLRPGRDVELRRGYSDAGTALWGRIIDVVRAKSVEEFFRLVPHSVVIPTAASEEEAVETAKKILKLENGSSKDVIGFEIRLGEPMKIPLKAEFIPLVNSGSKTSTIRAGRRNFSLGPAEIVCGTQEIPVNIVNVAFKCVSEISEEDARNDGFESRQSLMGKLQSIYPHIKDDDFVTLIQFAVR